MEHFLIITNEVKDENLTRTEQIRTYLEAHGKRCTLCVVNHARIPDVKAGLMAEGCDCILVLGGDGTLLRAAVDTLGMNIPLLGVNLGMLGYLAEVDEKHLDATLNRLLNGEYERESRMMLRGSIWYQGEQSMQQEELHALNDIVITRSGPLQIIRFRISVNGQFLNEYQADGIIVSTPTGSTGYNMSAGGPIVEPGAKLIVLTPVCPHMPGSRSIVLAPEDEIIIEIAKGKQGQDQEVEASFDGSRSKLLHTGDRIIIQKSEQETEIIKMSKVSFLETLHKKMNSTRG